MIGFLSGIPKPSNDGLLLNVAGVGYLVNVTQSLLETIDDTSQNLELFIYTHVTENSLELYGFQNSQQKKLFLMLLSISGVGPKMALAILNLGFDIIKQAVDSSDVATFTSVKRVGKKLAQKIIIELKSKLDSTTEFSFELVSPKLQTVLATLIQLGFSESDITQVMKQLDSELSEAELIKQALQQLR